MNFRNGQITLQVIVFSAVSITLIAGFALWADTNIRAAYRGLNTALAFTIGEAGIEYYRWHLAHNSTDYWDGQGSTSTGPYIHDYYDKNGERLGEFLLTITPPPVGSTVVVVESEGTIDADDSIRKIIRVRLAKPSFAKYAVVANAAMRFGAGTETFGQMHSNGGIRFDGLAHNLITSAVADYDDPDHGGGNEFGVHTHLAPVDPLPPAAVPARTDVFEAGRQFPIQSADFIGITQDLSTMRTDAQTDGFYASSSGASGYDVQLNTNDTFSLYRVDSLFAPHWSCTNYLGQSGWGSWSIGGETLIGTYANPTNGIIFLEDDVWVRGQIDTARITIASGRFPDNPSTRSSISITNDVLYTNYDGQDVLSLIAQNNINIGMVSEDDLRVDAALVAQNGRVGRYYYRPPTGWQRCSPYHARDMITSYGMIATYLRYGFAYTDNTGYEFRNLIYDSNLLYSPPPSFPLTTDEYEQISWEEVQ